MFYGDPDHLDLLATQLSAVANNVRHHAGAMTGRAHQVRWQSIAADRFRHEVESTRQTLISKADAIDAAAAALRAHAAVVRSRIAEIAAIEQAALRWLGSEVHQGETTAEQGLSGIWQKAQEIGLGLSSLPPSGSKEWLDVGDRLKRSGVHLSW